MARFRLMEPQEKVIYVALGNDRDEGFKTLRWVLDKWKFHPISIIILHIDITKDTVKTYFGTMPASFVNEELVEFLRNQEQEKIDYLLSQYKLFCGKVKVDILKVEKCDKTTREHIIDMIRGLNITNLVMALTFMKSSSRRSRSAISGCFYIHQRKPEFCDLFVISGGKQILISQDRFIGSDLTLSSLDDHNSPIFKHQWESYAEEIENYLQHLLSQNFSEEEENNNNSPMEARFRELQNSNMSVVEKSEYLKTKIGELNETIRLKINEWKLNSNRRDKAEWAISFCNRREMEMETLTTREAESRTKLKEELDRTRKILGESRIDVEEMKEKQRSSFELQSKLSTKLRDLATLRSQVEEQLKNATIVDQSSVIDTIEQLKKQMNVIRLRIEFCNNNNGSNNNINVIELREFCNEEIRLATEDFSERLKIKARGDWSSVYKGRLNLQTVAIKFVKDAAMSEEDFRTKVKFLSNIRHPHFVSVTGFCYEPKCIVFEYMHNGTLRDMLFSTSRSSTRTNSPLTWHARVHIAAHVCSGLCYLHSAQPRPVAHARLEASKVLLDKNLVAKISGLGLGPCHDQAKTGSDLKAFGVLVIQLLTGSNWAGLLDEAVATDRVRLFGVLDGTGGAWPLDVAEGLALLALKCLNTNLSVEHVMEELVVLRQKADGLVDRRREGGEQQRHEFGEVPISFICPIFQVLMENPHVAADGFSYELEAIEKWFKMGRDTSPMTNLKLEHKFLTPNRTLNHLIQYWNNKRSIVSL